MSSPKGIHISPYYITASHPTDRAVVLVHPHTTAGCLRTRARHSYRREPQGLVAATAASVRVGLPVPTSTRQVKQWYRPAGVRGSVVRVGWAGATSCTRYSPSGMRVRCSDRNLRRPTCNCARAAGPLVRADTSRSRRYRGMGLYSSRLAQPEVKLLRVDTCMPCYCMCRR